MLRKESEIVPERNSPILQDAGKMVRWKELRRVVKETWCEASKEIKDDLRNMNQRIARLEQDAR